MRENPLILIADDDPGFQEIISAKLKSNGFLVAEAHDGKEAVDKAVNLHPEMIIMDINMPGSSGTEAVLDIVKNPETKDVKIIFFTSMEDPWPAFKKKSPNVAKELGAVDFFNKSDDLDGIVAKIKELLSK